MLESHSTGKAPLIPLSLFSPVLAFHIKLEQVMLLRATVQQIHVKQKVEIRSSSRNTEKNILSVLFSFRWRKLEKCKQIITYIKRGQSKELFTCRWHVIV